MAKSTYRIGEDYVENHTFALFSTEGFVLFIEREGRF